MSRRLVSTIGRRAAWGSRCGDVAPRSRSRSRSRSPRSRRQRCGRPSRSEAGASCGRVQSQRSGARRTHPTTDEIRLNTTASARSNRPGHTGTRIKTSSPTRQPVACWSFGLDRAEFGFIVECRVSRPKHATLRSAPSLTDILGLGLGCAAIYCQSRLDELTLAVAVAVLAPRARVRAPNRSTFGTSAAQPSPAQPYAALRSLPEQAG